MGKPNGFPCGTVEVEVAQLTDAKGRKLTPKKHRSCPGHAAFIDTNGSPIHVASTARTGATGRLRTTGT
jgi:hypothetical protein